MGAAWSGACLFLSYVIFASVYLSYAARGRGPAEDQKSHRCALDHAMRVGAAGFDDSLGLEPIRWADREPAYGEYCWAEQESTDEPPRGCSNEYYRLWLAAGVPSVEACFALGDASAREPKLAAPWTNETRRWGTAPRRRRDNAATPPRQCRDAAATPPRRRRDAAAATTQATT